MRSGDGTDELMYSAFMDPACVSGFAPVLGENAFNLQYAREDGRLQDGLLLCLQAGDVRRTPRCRVYS